MATWPPRESTEGGIGRWRSGKCPCGRTIRRRTSSAARRTSATERGCASTGLTGRATSVRCESATSATSPTGRSSSASERTRGTAGVAASTRSGTPALPPRPGARIPTLPHAGPASQWPRPRRTGRGTEGARGGLPGHRKRMPDRHRRRRKPRRLLERRTIQRWGRSHPVGQLRPGHRTHGQRRRQPRKGPRPVGRPVARTRRNLEAGRR
mmetsp:Transcript_2725/g.11222  ORF Transcript_2725/g.11222 Transcript_2725/m.11222 type:complete len:210 (-) Transcript_2725:49-678(-)